VTICFIGHLQCSTNVFRDSLLTQMLHKLITDTLADKRSGMLRCFSNRCMCITSVQSSVWSDMLEELRFAVRCHGSAKKPKLRRHCSKCGLDGGTCPGTDAAAAGEPSPNGVLLAQSASTVSTVPRPSIVDDRLLHYRRSARLDCDYAVDRRRTSIRCAEFDYTDRRPSGTSELRQDAVKTPDRFRDSPVVDSLAPNFAKV